MYCRVDCDDERFIRHRIVVDGQPFAPHRYKTDWPRFAASSIAIMRSRPNEGIDRHRIVVAGH